MKRTTSESCFHSREIGAGCSQSSRPLCGGCAVAPGSRKRAGCSVAPAPHCERKQTDRRTDRQTDRQTDGRTDSSRRICFCLCALPCVCSAPLCRGSSGRSPVRGRFASGAECPGALCGLRHDNAPRPSSPLAGGSELGAVCPGAGCPVRCAGFATTTPRAPRPRCCASRPPCAKRLRPYRVPSDSRVECQGRRGFLLRVASGLCPVLEMGVIL
jgi:hypothetical protein